MQRLLALALISTCLALAQTATPPIGGSTLPPGGCFTQAVTVTGAAVGNVVNVTPAALIPNGVWMYGVVTAANSVTVKVCSSLSQQVPAVVYYVTSGSAGGGSVTGVSATAPITSTGGSTPDIACPTCSTGTPVTSVTATSPVVSTGGTTPVISCPTCSTATPVTSVTATSPVVSTGGTTPVISCPTCSTATPVTSVTATAPITSSGGTTPVISATYQGNGAKVQASTGTTTTNDCVKYDANGNTIDQGQQCGTMVLISGQTLASATNSVSFSSIPATYRNLYVTVIARNTASATTEDIFLQVNGDSGADYNYALNAGNSSSGGAPISVIATGQTSFDLASFPAGTAPTGEAGVLALTIPNYTQTTFNKSMLAQSYRLQTSTVGITVNWSGSWASTAAITSLTLSATTGNFAVGSIFSLYGF